MIRFACPACHTVVQVVDQYAGAKVACNKCGQRIQAPALSAAKTVLASPLLPEPPPPDRVLAKSSPALRPVNHVACPACGRKVVIRGKPAGKNAPCPQCGAQLAFSQGGAPTVVSIVPTPLEQKPPSRRKSSWPPYLYGFLALIIGLAALPAGFALSSHVIGIVAAALGLLCGLYGVGSSLTRRGAGIGFTSLTVFISGAALLASVVLAGGFSWPGGSGAVTLPKGTPNKSDPAPIVKKLDVGSAAEKGESAVNEEAADAKEGESADALGKVGSGAKPAARSLDTPAPAPLTLKEAMEKQAASLAKVQLAADARRKARGVGDKTAAEGDFQDARAASQKELAEMAGSPIRLAGVAVAVEAQEKGFIRIAVDVGNDVLVHARASATDWPHLKRRDKIRLIGKIQAGHPAIGLQDGKIVLYPRGWPPVCEAKPDTSTDEKEKPADALGKVGSGAKPAARSLDTPAPAPLTLKEAMEKQAASLAKVQLAADAPRKARTEADRIAAEGDLADAKAASQKEMAAMRGIPIQVAGVAVAVNKAPQPGFILITVHVGDDVFVSVRASTTDWPDLKRRDKIRLVGKIQGMYPPGFPLVCEAKPDHSANKVNAKPADSK